MGALDWNLSRNFNHERSSGWDQISAIQYDKDVCRDFSMELVQKDISHLTSVHG